MNSATGSLSNYLSSSSALKAVIGSYDGVNAFVPQGWFFGSIWQMEASAQDYLGYAADNSSGTLPDSTGGDVAVQAYLGGGAGKGGTPGSGGAAGDGGTVNATNNFQIQTFGPASPGISAQSVGAGGGMAGATTVNQYQLTSGNKTQATVQIGGTANNMGNGGAVTANNNGLIGTAGDASFGIFAQSVGAGGGQAIVTASNFQSPDGTTPAISIALAGDMTSAGNGGAVTVNHNANGTISTAGNEAVGIVAQSVGGGGGDAIVLQTGANTQGYSVGVAATNNTAQSSTVKVGSNFYLSPITYPYLTGCSAPGGTDRVMNSCGAGGTITVNTAATSSVRTTGTHSHGILAQSIGGGGGWIVGLLPSAAQPFVKDPSMGGNGGDINVSIAGSVSTTGAAAYGVLAQSVGGGGILGGYIGGGAVSKFQQDGTGNGPGRYGSGGDIDISVSGSVSTTGANSHAVFAQSVGGGGGLWATGNGITMGSVGGNGTAGSILITNTGTIQAAGQDASAIYVNSAGDNKAANVNINNSGVITGNSTAAAIVLTGGNTVGNGDGFVINNGTLNAMNGIAVSAPDSFAEVSNNAGGTVNGNIQIGAQGSFANRGYWGSGDSSIAGQISNMGTLNINGANGNALGKSSITGAFYNSGALQSSIDFYNAQAAQLSVSGAAVLYDGSSILVRPTLLAPNAVTILQAGSFTLSNSAPIPVTDPGGNYLFSYALGASAQSLTVRPTTSAFYARAVANTTNVNLISAAGVLDANWAYTALSTAQAQVFASFATISNAGDYITALTNISNESSAAASVASLTAANAFVERMNSCPRFDGDGLFQTEHTCVWGRTIATDADHSASSSSIGYHQSGQTFQLGGQKEVATDWFVGASASADNSSLDTHTVNDSVSGHGWTLGLVAKHQMGDWLVSGAITGGQMSFDSTRQVQIPGVAGTATASYDVNEIGRHSRISRQFLYDSWYLKPYMDLHATHIETGSYVEQGAGPLDLQASSSSTNVLSASPMLEAGTRIDLSHRMTLQAYAGIGATFYNQNNLGASLQFAEAAPGSAAFQVGSDLPTSRFKSTAGLDLGVSDQVDIRFEYSGEFADHYHSNTAALKVTYKF